MRRVLAGLAEQAPHQAFDTAGARSSATPATVLGRDHCCCFGHVLGPLSSMHVGLREDGGFKLGDLSG